MRRLVPLLALALVLGCSARERANPFDPNNPDTSGRPSGFVALAGHGRVTLRWLAVSGSTLVGFQVYRRGPTESTYIPISGVLPVTATEFTDVGLVNGFDYAYRLYFVFDAGLGSRPAEDVATPGPTLPWVVEAFGPEALRITPDGRRVAFRLGGFAGTNDIAVNPATGVVWISDADRGRIEIYNPVTRVRIAIPVGDPVAIAVDPYDGTAWICDQQNETVLHLTPQGDPASFPISNVTTPYDAAVDAEDGSVWVIERFANRLGRFDASANRILTTPVPSPTRVAVDSITRVAWVTSYTRGTVTRIDVSGAIVDTLDLFTTPFGIAIDTQRGRIWVADPGVGEVIALRRDGTVEFRLTGFTNAGELSVDPASGDVWVVLADPGQVVRIAPTGAVRRRLTGLTAPIAIGVDPGPR